MSAHNQDVEKTQRLKEKSLTDLSFYGKIINKIIAPVKANDLETLLKDEKFKKTLTPERRLTLAINIIDACISMHSEKQFMCTIDRKNILVKPDTLEVQIISMANSFRAKDSIAPEDYERFKQSGCMPEPTKEGDIYFIVQCLLIPILAGRKFCQASDLGNDIIYYESHSVTDGENKILGKTITESHNIRKKRLVPLLDELRVENPEKRESLINAKKELATILAFVEQINESKTSDTQNRSNFWVTGSEKHSTGLANDSTGQTHRPNTPRALSGSTG